MPHQNAVEAAIAAGDIEKAREEIAAGLQQEAVEVELNRRMREQKDRIEREAVAKAERERREQARTDLTAAVAARNEAANQFDSALGQVEAGFNEVNRRNQEVARLKALAQADVNQPGHESLKHFVYLRALRHLAPNFFRALRIQPAPGPRGRNQPLAQILKREAVR